MLIIYSHPNKNGHCGYALKKVQEILDQKNEKYEVLDLYAMNFNPILSQDEIYNHKISADVTAIQEKIKNNDKFVIIYPVWWNDTPAILKGFFDRVLSQDFAFKYTDKFPIGLLKGKKTAVIATSGGPKLITILLSGNRSLKNVVKSTLNFCGIKAKGFLIGSAFEFNDKQKIKIEKAVKGAMNFLAD